jgi:hypothetical protein
VQSDGEKDFFEMGSDYLFTPTVYTFSNMTCRVNPNPPRTGSEASKKKLTKKILVKANSNDFVVFDQQGNPSCDSLSQQLNFCND